MSVSNVSGTYLQEQEESEETQEIEETERHEGPLVMSPTSTSSMASSVMAAGSY